jgi:serine/threonine-protein kinase
VKSRQTIVAPAAPVPAAGRAPQPVAPAPIQRRAETKDAVHEQFAAGEISELAPGTLIHDKYQVVELIGQGGMGSVYRATQLNLGREVALKLLSPALATNDLGRRRFEREARVAATLSHPVAVQIYDVGASGPFVYIAMEILEGAPLRDFMQDGVPMPVSRVLEVAAPLVEVLVAAHAIPLVHRDLKPENVFIEQAEDREAIRVLDFGLAFVEGESEMGRLTREGLVVGTPAYLSPEQAQGKVVGPPGDIYSLGCMLYEMATGWPPFLGSWMNVLTQHLYVAPVSLRERAPDAGIPSDLDALVIQMLAKQPFERPSIEAVREGLQRVSGTLAGARHRGRGDRMLGERTDRMISVPAALALAPDARLPTDVEIIDAGFVGDLTHEIIVALASNGVRALPMQPHGGETPRCSVVIVSEGNDALLERTVQEGHAVVAVADTSDVERISQLLRLGVADVAPTPVRIDELTRKVRRVHARRKRKRKT